MTESPKLYLRCCHTTVSPATSRAIHSNHTTTGYENHDVVHYPVSRPLLWRRII
jgi:hypothetical protein